MSMYLPKGVDLEHFVKAKDSVLCRTPEDSFRVLDSNGMSSDRLTSHSCSKA